MSRERFLLGASPHIFWPSVHEVWEDKSDGRRMLLYSTFEPHGFHCVGFNCDFTLNFNHLPEDWLERNIYVRTLTDEEVTEVLRIKRVKGWL